MRNRLLYLFFSLSLLSSCNTSKEIIYFQDVEVNNPKVIAPPKDITVQPKDQISIVVSSKDPELAALFNLTRVQYKVGLTIMEKFPAIHWMTRAPSTSPYWETSP